MDLDRNKAVNNSEALKYASDLLYGFDIQDADSRDFLSSLITAGQVPQAELRELFNIALMRGQEEWDMLLACAGAVRTGSLRDGHEDPGFAPYLAYVLSARAVGDELATAGAKEGKKRQRRTSAPKRKTSRFWQDEKAVRRKPDEILNETAQTDGNHGASTSIPAEAADTSAEEAAEPSPGPDPSSLLEDATAAQLVPPFSPSPSSSPSRLQSHHHHTQTLKRTRPLKSPFFTPSPTKKPPRPARGTVSSLPFPPLSSPRFGLVQESLSHDPFRLLVAVTFLIRTSGRAAIPVFHSVMGRFPTPEAFVAAEDLAAELGPMIAHLGLPGVRCAAIGRYARGWVAKRPERGVRFRVGGYPRVAAALGHGEGVEGVEGEGGEGRKDGSSGGDGEGAGAAATESSRRRRRKKGNSSEWEIGHLTQGRYAIDSWRIFCRDIFLGKSDDWMGASGRLEAGEEGPFEPEWMRVLPEDKELRACLRWMWMREGWEWDPVSGRKSPLREEMRMAVEEGRVKYDEKGELVILDGPLGGTGVGDGGG